MFADLSLQVASHIPLILGHPSGLGNQGSYKVYLSLFTDPHSRCQVYISLITDH